MRSAIQMRHIERGALPLTKAWHTIMDVAERYNLHPQSVYEGVRQQHPLYPKAQLQGAGERPRLAVSREALLACDQDRLAFYRTTPSWCKRFVKGAPVAPARRSAQSVLAARRAGHKEE